MSEFQPKPGDVVAVKMKWDEPWDDPGDVAPWVPAERIAALEALEAVLLYHGETTLPADVNRALAASLATREENR